MDNLDLIVKEKKLNIKHIILALLSLILLILFFFIICKKINVFILGKAEEESARQMQMMQQNEIIENQIVENDANEKEINKYKKLSEDDIQIIDKIYYHSEPKRVFLTFDDGPTSQVTPYILNVLDEKKVKANFFVLGTKAEKNKDIVKREYQRGDFIGNHGYSHKYSEIYSSIDSFFDEYNRTQQIIRDATENQNYNSLVCRFPGGSTGGPYNAIKAEIKSKLHENGIADVDWNALTYDADGAKTKEKIIENFHNTIQNETSVVLLMHDASDKILTYETLPEIIDYFQQNGFEFKTIYDILGR